MAFSVVLFDSWQTFCDKNGSVAKGDKIAPRQKHMCRACMYGPESVPHIYGMSALPPEKLFGRSLIEPVRDKTNNLGFRPGLTQTRLHSHRSRLEA